MFMACNVGGFDKYPQLQRIHLCTKCVFNICIVAYTCTGMYGSMNFFIHIRLHSIYEVIMELSLQQFSTSFIMSVGGEQSYMECILIIYVFVKPVPL